MSKTASANSPVTELICNLVLPFLILSNGKKWFGLGAEAAMIIALLFPMAYFAWDWWRTRMLNGFALLGFFGVLVTGLIGLMKLGPMAFAIKETALSLLFGLMTVSTAFFGTPMFESLIAGSRNRMNIDLARLNEILAEAGRRESFRKLMKRCTLIFASSFLVSAVANFILSRLIVVTDPSAGEAALDQYNAEVARQSVVSFVVLGVMSFPLMYLALVELMKGFKKITQTEFETLLPKKIGQ